MPVSKLKRKIYESYIYNLTHKQVHYDYLKFRNKIIYLKLVPLLKSNYGTCGFINKIKLKKKNLLCDFWKTKWLSNKYSKINDFIFIIFKMLKILCNAIKANRNKIRCYILWYKHRRKLLFWFMVLQYILSECVIHMPH